MKRPWQIWTTYVIALLVTAAAVGGVTLHAWKADRAEQETRAQAAVEENARLALWRMDSILVPLVAQESARSPADYRLLIGKPKPKLPPAGAVKNEPPAKVAVSPLPFPEEVQAYFDISGSQSQFAFAPKLKQSSAEATIQQRLKSLLNFRTMLAELPAPAEIDSPAQVAYVNEGYILPQSTYNQNSNLNEDSQTSRGRQEFEARRQYVQTNSAIGNRNGYANFAPVPDDFKTGALRPLIVNGELLLARQTNVNGKTHVQGCWLDWTGIRARLLGEVVQQLPQAELKLAKAVPEEESARLLASLPVKLELPTAAPTIATLSSPLRLTLGIAWGSLALAAVAVALLLRGVLVLSERRASFVSAVTHELRTPLTTFKMYAEMLAEGMVPDEQTRDRYLGTLRTEADRLSHLVENVLAYAKLERGGLGNRIRTVSVGELLEIAVPRAADRAKQARFDLEVTASDSVQDVTALADPSAVEQIIFNLVDNAAKYAASATDRRIHLQVETGERQLMLTVRDHGPGISLQEQRRLFEPFRKSASEAAASAPGVGLGLALSRRLARDMGGDLLWENQVAQGAGFVLTLKRGGRSR